MLKFLDQYVHSVLKLTRYFFKGTCLQFLNSDCGVNINVFASKLNHGS